MGNSSVAPSVNPSGVLNTKWENLILFVDLDIDPRYPRRDDSDEVADYFNMESSFKRIEMYRCKKGKRKLSKSLNHVYVILESEDFYCLVEKTTSFLVVQKSNDKSELKKFDVHDEWDESSAMIYNDTVKKGMNVSELFIYLEGEKKNGYNLFFDNCQHFAQRCFNYFATKEKCDRY